MSKNAEAVPVYAGAVVRAPDGRILCQLRDDTPEIVCPGLWSCCPGGRLKAGESPLQGVIRELWEEFEIEVGGLSSLPTYTEAEGEYFGIYHGFVGDLLTPMANVKCNEGVRATFFSPQDAVLFPQHPMSLRFLWAYLDRPAG